VYVTISREQTITRVQTVRIDTMTLNPDELAQLQAIDFGDYGPECLDTADRLLLEQGHEVTEEVTDVLATESTTVQFDR
jgi:hypothetical protein